MKKETGFTINDRKTEKDKEQARILKLIDDKIKKHEKWLKNVSNENHRLGIIGGITTLKILKSQIKVKK